MTKEQILSEIRREAAQKEAERQRLEAWKPQRRLHELDEVREKMDAERVRFHHELRQILKDRGKRAGPMIEDLCNEYGRNTLPEIEGMVRRALRLSVGGLPRQDQVEMMRSHGLPEPKILDYIANKLHRDLGSRGGPRDEKEVLVEAARRLLAMPLAPAQGEPHTDRAFRPGSQPLATAPQPSIPNPGHRP